VIPVTGLPDYKFDLTVFEEASDAGLLRDGPVHMNGMTVLARQAMVGPRFAHFAVRGALYWYSVSAWPSQVQINVLRGADIYHLERCSVMHPRNQSELLEAINTIALDFENRLDAAA
jgi:hypothetical protein